jgi:hypothetical protein
MPDRPPVPPKAPNNDAKAVDRWDDEGGAPSGSQPMRKRRRDIAPGQIEDRKSEPKGKGGQRAKPSTASKRANDPLSAEVI